MFKFSRFSAVRFDSFSTVTKDQREKQRFQNNRIFLSNLHRNQKRCAGNPPDVFVWLLILRIRLALLIVFVRSSVNLCFIFLSHCVVLFHRVGMRIVIVCECNDSNIELQRFCFQTQKNTHANMIYPQIERTYTSRQQ